jgi:tetratricopeptide (TPR) repeat protein
VELYPDHAGAWYELGITYQQMKDQKNAVESFEKAIAINEEFEWALNSLAVSLAIMGKFDEALETVNKTLEIDPDNQEALDLKRDIEDLIKISEEE